MNTLILILKSFLEPKIFTGVVKDTRSSYEQSQDPTHEEFVPAGAPGVTWVERSVYKKFPKRDQLDSFSCVMQSNAKARGVTYANQGGNFPILSALPYNRRSNFPGEGTVPYEGLTITSQGLPLESLYPSQRMTESQMNAARKPPIDPTYAGSLPVKLPLDMDTIASVVDQGYGIVMCNTFASAEYAQYIPMTLRGLFRGVDHQISIVDRTLISGKKTFICEDSAFLSSSKDGQRIITEDFLLNHSYFIGYIRNVKAPQYGAVVRPLHMFTVNIAFGDQSNEVMVYQQRLVFEGYLSPDCMTGYFGGLTQRATMAYQEALGVSPTGHVGPITRAKLNS